MYETYAQIFQRHHQNVEFRFIHEVRVNGTSNDEYATETLHPAFTPSMHWDLAVISV